jgi:hypothetical protein
MATFTSGSRRGCDSSALLDWKRSSAGMSRQLKRSEVSKQTLSEARHLCAGITEAGTFVKIETLVRTCDCG